MPPLAGVFEIARLRFALYDLAGVVLWAGTWLALGYFFSDAIVVISAKASALGRMLGLVIVTALAGYILVKWASPPVPRSSPDCPIAQVKLGSSTRDQKHVDSDPWNLTYGQG